MPKVLRIVNRFNLGGPTYNAAYLTKYLAPEYDTMLIGGAPIKGEAHSGYILDQLGVAYIEIPEMSRSINPMNDIQAFRKIRRIIREYKPDIVHTHAAKAGALGRLAAWFENVPIIVHTYHGHVFSQYFGSLKSRIIQSVERWLANKTTAIITISSKQFDDIVNQFKICPAEKAHHISLGFDLSRFSLEQENKRTQFRNKYTLEEGTIAIGIIGRFAPVKNHHLFFEALFELNKHAQNWKALVIGDGILKAQMMQHVSEMELKEKNSFASKIIFTSWIKNIDEALAGLDIVVLTSLNEGTPVSLIEAQAAGKPVVSTDVGGVRDCVVDGKTGFITQGNASELAEAIGALLSDEALRQQMGLEGQKFVTGAYHYTRLVSEISSLYKKLHSKLE